MKKIRNYSAITAHGDVPARKMVLDLMVIGHTQGVNRARIPPIRPVKKM